MRQAKGVSLVELLVATLMMGFVATAAFGMMTLTMNSTIKVENKCDNLNVVRNAIEKISRGVRMGRSIGDIFGNMGAGGANEGSITYPSTLNPIHSATAPPAGWPTWGDGTNPSSFTLGPRCLVVQRPVFDNNGFPIVIRAGQGNPALGYSTCNVVTDVYRIVPDTSPNANGEWIMQWCQFPGLTVTGYTANAAAQLGPITLVRGIIGPLDNTNQPKVFSYLAKPALDPTQTLREPGDSLNPPMDNANIGNFSGVDVTLEIRNHDSSAMVNNAYVKDSVLAFKQLMYLRNNSLATMTGPP